MLAVRTPGAPQTARGDAGCGSAFPFERQGRPLRSRSISGLFSRSLYSALQPPCLRFAAAVTGRHARLGTRLLARLCRDRHLRRQTSTRLQGATLAERCVRLSPHTAPIRQTRRPCLDAMKPSFASAARLRIRRHRWKNLPPTAPSGRLRFTCHRLYHREPPLAPPGGRRRQGQRTQGHPGAFDRLAEEEGFKDVIVDGLICPGLR